MKRKQSDQPGTGKLLDAWSPPEEAGEPIGCLATSFTFDAELFEEECLARFVALESTLEDGAVYVQEREEKLAQLQCAAVLVDQQHATGKRSLRWDLLSARLPRGILHAKVSLLYWSRRVRLIVTSANLTKPGYRQNHEVCGVLDFFEGGGAPRDVLQQFVEFLEQAVAYAAPPAAEKKSDRRTNAAVERWRALLQRVRKESRGWGVDQPRGWAQPRVAGVFSGPGYPNCLETLGKLWPDDTRPHYAAVVSPFFDPPEADNAPARQIWGLLRKRGEIEVEYDVVTGENSGAKDVIPLRAPQTLQSAQPADRPGATTTFCRLVLEEGRPLHAKCYWFASDKFLLYQIGSSNFTSAGLGLGPAPNLEANLAYVIRLDSTNAVKAFKDAWPEYESLPPKADLRWQPVSGESEDSEAEGAPVLPAAFACATYGVDREQAYVEFEFAGDPPAGWRVTFEQQTEPVLTEAQWLAQGRPDKLRLAWRHVRPPNEFAVSWTGAIKPAYWPVIVADSSALPPPEELQELSLEELLERLTSSRPYTILRRAQRAAAQQAGSAEPALDPHARVDTSAFLLQRTRRVSWALAALRKRLEQPVYSQPSLDWRLRGPLGALALAQAIEREAQSDLERCFLLTELCLELGRVRPETVLGGLRKTDVRQELLALAQEIRQRIPSEALHQDPSLREYAARALQEVAP